MNAESRTVCPKCRAAHALALADAERKAKVAYGHVPAVDYLRLAEEVRRLNAEGPGEELDQWWEENSGMGPDGVLCLHYRCHCRSCGWSAHHETEVQMPMEGTP